MPTAGEAGQGSSCGLCTGHVDALFRGQCASPIRQRRVARQHAIIRLDVMRPISKTVLHPRPPCLRGGNRAPTLRQSRAQEPPKRRRQGEGCRQATAQAQSRAAQASQGADASRGARTRRSQPVASASRWRRRPQHVARYDAAIAPARDHRSRADGRRAACARPWRPAAGGRLAEAKAIRDKIGDPAARKLVDWFVYRGGYGTASEIRAFLEANPAWPDRGLLTQRAEEALFNGAASAARRQGLLRRHPAPHRRRPRRAGVRATWPTRTRRRPRRWRRRPGSISTCPPSLEPAFLKRVGGLLTEADHKRRLDRLLFNDSRWTGERNERAVVIRRVIALLSEDEKKKAEARLAVFLRAKNSSQLLVQAAGARARPTGDSPCRRPRPCAARRRRRRPGRSCWRIRDDQAPSSRTAGGRSGAPTPMRRCRLGKPKTGLRSGAQSRPALGQRRQGRVLPGGLAGAAPSARHQAGARPFRGAGQGGRRPAEPCARPILARPHATRRSATRPRPRSTTGRFRLLRHLPRPARAPQGRSAARTP